MRVLFIKQNKRSKGGGGERLMILIPPFRSLIFWRLWFLPPGGLWTEWPNWPIKVEYVIDYYLTDVPFSQDRGSTVHETTGLSLAAPSQNNVSILNELPETPARRQNKKWKKNPKKQSTSLTPNSLTVSKQPLCAGWCAVLLQIVST